MAIEYNLSPVYHIVFRDALGVPASNGTVETYKATSHTTPKAVYEDKAGTIPFTNPIQLNAAGVVGDVSGAPKPIYWSSDEDYYVVVKDSSSAIIQTVDNYNAPVNDLPTPQVTDVDFSNYVLNPQFRLFQKRKYLSDELPAHTETPIAEEGWIFNRSNTNTTTNIRIIEFLAGQTDVPNNPPNYCELECTAIGAAGETFKLIAQRLGSVETFNGEKISFSFWAKASALNPIGFNVEIILEQDFGSGGSSLVNTILETFTLTSSWTQYTFEAVAIPSISGKTVKPGNRALLAIEVAANEILTVNFTNVQINRGDQLLEFDYKSKNLDNLDRRSYDLPDIPNLEKNYESRALAINSNRLLEYTGGVSYVGATLLSFRKDTILGWLLCRGQSISHWRYPDLWNVYPAIFGTPSDSMTATRSTNIVNTTNWVAGTVTDAADVDTGFGFSNSSQYDYTPTVSSNEVTITNDANGNVTDIADGSGTWAFSVSVLTDTVTITNTANGNVTDIADGSSTWDFTSAVGSLPETYMTITNNSNGAVTKIVDGPVSEGKATNFVLLTTQQGTGALPQISRVIVPDNIPNINALYSLQGGEYFTFSSTTHDFYVWFIVNGNGSDPSLTGKIGISVSIVNEDGFSIATKIKNALKVATGFTFATTQQGTAVLPEISTVQCKAANLASHPLAGDEYFTFQSTTYSFTAYYIVDGKGNLPAQSGRILIPIAIGGTDSANTVAQKTKDALDKATGFVFTTVQQGTGSVPEISKVTTNSAATKPLLGGEYFIFHSTTAIFVCWYRVDGKGYISTTVSGYHIEIPISSTDSANTIATKTREALWGHHKVAITCNAASTLNGGEHFKIYGYGTVEKKYYVWFRKDGIGIDPAPTTFTEILTDISEDDTNEEVAEKLKDVLHHILWKLPDPRGLFLRIQDDGKGIDPDASSRTTRGDGTTGDNPGTIQQDIFRRHRHSLGAQKREDGSDQTVYGAQGEDLGAVTEEVGDNETRPKNIYLNMYMKY